MIGLIAPAFAAGTLLLLLQPQLPGQPAVAVATLVGAALATVRGVRFAGWVLLGFCWAALISGHRLAERLPPALHNSDRVVHGTVVGLVQRRGDTVSFVVRADVAQRRSVRVALRWYEYPPARPLPRPGESWQLRVRLRVPRGLANPGQARFERTALRRGLAATGYVRAGSDNRRISTPRRWRLDALRMSLSQRLHDLLGQSDSGALIAALAVADRQYLQPRHWQVMRRTGLSHLLAISGLHIGMIAVAAYRLGALAGSFVNRGIGCGCLCSVLGAGAYAALAGFSVPTQRALVVVVMLLAGRWRRRQTRPGNSLSLALLIIVCIDPFAVLDRGFWLSFGAVATILFSLSGAAGRHRLRSALRVQAAITVALAPLMVVFFGEISLIAPLLNLIAIPVAGLALVPALLASVAVYSLSPHGAGALTVIAAALDLVWPWLERLAAWPLAAWTPGPAPVWISLLALTGAYWLLTPPGWPARWLGAVMLLPILTWRPAAPAHGALRATVLDVGHGMAVVLRTARHVLVYDAGPAWPGGNDAARRVVIPFLERQRSPAPDLIVISHGDNDHAGGLESLRVRYPDTEVLANDLGGANRCVHGTRWFWDGVAFTVLHPPRAGHWSANDASCVLRIDTSGGCLLLTGDIEARAERALVQGSLSRCEVVAGLHHGSKTSSSPGFVAAVSPAHVLFPTAYANRWGFPRPSVLARWQTAGAAVHDTGNDGAITVLFDHRGGYTVQRERCRARRLWSPDCSR